MTAKFLHELNILVCTNVRNVTSHNWANNVNCDKSIYKDYAEYEEVKIRETIHFFAVNKGLMK